MTKYCDYHITEMIWHQKLNDNYVVLCRRLPSRRRMFGSAEIFAAVAEKNAAAVIPAEFLKFFIRLKN